VSASETIETLMGRPYAVQLTKAGGRYWMEIAELRLLADGASVDDAYAKLDAEKRRLFESYIRAGKAARVPLPGAMEQRREMARSLKPFFIKAAVLACIGALLIVAANVSIFYVLDAAPTLIAKKASRAAIQRLGRFATEELTGEKQQKLRRTMREAVAKLQPFSVELAPLFPCSARDPARQ
jgi:uncharacterized membrane protein